MSLLSKILGKLGIGDDAQAAPTAAPPVAPPPSAPPPTDPGLSAGAPMASGVDVAAKLDAMPGSQGLNWRTSIVDLLKLLGLDSSLTSRQELADELGCPAATKADSAQMNTWLHSQVMQKLAANGGQVPADLLKHHT